MASGDQAPSPEALARLLLEHGEPEHALRVCASWRRRSPNDPRVHAVEMEARRSVHPQRPLPLDRAIAERFVQHGYLAEALEIYRILDAARVLDAGGAGRLRLLEELVAYALPPDADPRQLAAEQHVAARRLPSALLDYRELARSRPTDEEIIRRADQLRSVVLGVPPAIRAEAGSDEMTRTAEMPLDTKALLMLREGNLAVAAQLYAVISSRSGGPSRPSELAGALARLAGLTTGSGLEESRDGEGTARLGPEGFAAFHVRVGNFAEAAELYRGLVERYPASSRLRQRLDDLRTVLGHLQEVGGGPAPAAQRGSSGGGRVTPPARRRSEPPRPERALGKRSGSYELAAFRPPEPGECSGGSSAFDEEEATLRVGKRQLADIHLARGSFEKAIELYAELVAEQPDDAELRRTLEAVRARFGRSLYEDDGEGTSTMIERPLVESKRKEESRPAFESAALVDALGRAPLPGQEPERSASWIPTRRHPTGPDAEPPTEVEARRRKEARTVESRLPTVQDVEGSSVVEVPSSLSSVIERTAGRVDASEAAEVAEGFGVAVRPILLIE